MNDLNIGRRDFVRLSLLSACFGLSGCQLKVNQSIISSYKGILPKELIKNLPSSWRFKLLRSQLRDVPYRFESTEGFDFLAIGDGWLQNLPMEKFSPIAIDEQRILLNKQAKLFLSNFATEVSERLFPIGFSPWVMLFRRGEDWIPNAKKTWQVLLEPGLKNQLVLPKSPRIVMELADRIGGKEALRDLRLQVKTFDDRNALNWLLSGNVKVVVMPLQNCMSSLLKDPRLTVAIPAEGAPLNWTVLLRTTISKQSSSISWIKNTYEIPLLSKLLSKGWIPPFNYSEVLRRVAYDRGRTNPLIPFSEIAYNNSWPLEPLNKVTTRVLEERWSNSTP